MATKMLLLLALVAAAAADGQSYESSYGGSSEEAKYDFSYQVKDDDGNDFGHKESRDGDKTEGYYYVYLPDGRLQKVTYYVSGDSGYVADVQYSGEAHYDSDSGSRESYRPPYSSDSRESRESFGSGYSNESK